jgi:hypothetical protein
MMWQIPARETSNGHKRCRRAARGGGLALAILILGGCAQTFPQPDAGHEFTDDLTANELFARTMAAHGGDLREYPGDINLATDGDWGWWIQRIQPLVADAGYRVVAEERYRPADELYAIRYEGPEGVKKIIREGRDITVYYDGERENDPDNLAATAMTTDAVKLFHYGPSFIKHRARTMTRLPDAEDDGVRYRRVLAEIAPGFGEADDDEVVMWIHPETDLLYRVHLTLNGFETTQGAHVDTTFLAYAEVGGYTLPNEFSERVRGPLRLWAHDWWVTDIDIDRGWAPGDVRGAEFTGEAAPPAGAD